MERSVFVSQLHLEYVIAGTPIRVAYGYSESPGVFLSVCDERLEYDENATDEVNVVTANIWVKDGGGSYFDLHTGLSGYGLKVDDKTMATFLERYGVTDEQIRLLPLQLDIGNAAVKKRSPDVCDVCNKQASSWCSRCVEVDYCSKDCQKKAWAVHKVFCGIQQHQAIASDTDDRYIRALFLPENEATPLLVNLPLKRVQDEDGRFRHIDATLYIDGMTGTFRSDFFPKQDPTWEEAYHLLYKDDALIDGLSMENCCLKNIVEKVAKGVFGDQRFLPKGSKHLNRGPAIHFKGNILVVKAEKNRGAYLQSAAPTYLDVGPKDMNRIANVIYQVNLAYSADG